jgi:hypothetical protein
MTTRFSRRLFLRQALGLGAAGAAIGALEGVHFASQIRDQHETWLEASRSNAEFFGRHAADLQRLTLGASFAPEQWSLTPEGQTEALRGLDFAVSEMGARQLRIGLRWRRSVDGDGGIDLTAYRPMLDYCFSHDIAICLNPGPVRVFRSPEEHVPREVLDRIEGAQAAKSAVRPEDPLAKAALDYLERLLHELSREYGDAFAHITTVQLENEPFYPLGKHEWRFSTAYLREVAQRIDAALPAARVLITSAGRLNLNEVREAIADLQAANPRFEGRMVSGIDFHYKTPRRDSVPVIRHFDQITYGHPFSPTPYQHIEDSRRFGFKIEVTEAQAEPYLQFRTPGNSARDFRFVILRLLDNVLDPREPALIRIWGVEELAKRFLRGEATEEHRQILEMIQTVNESGSTDGTAGASTRR